MLNPLVSDRKPVAVRGDVRLIVNLTIFALVFAVAVLAMLLFILMDLAPKTGLRPGQEYEAVRIAVELFVLVGSGGMTVWNLRYRTAGRDRE